VSRQPGSIDGQLDPVADWQILRPAHPPDIARLNAMLEDRVASGGHAHDAVARDLECLVV
jgi:hypothetical protein